DAATGGSLEAFMTEAGFEGKAEETLAVPAGKLGVKGALLVGLGDKKTVSADRIRRAAAAVVRRSPKAKTVATTLLDTVPSGGDRAAAAQALAEGAALGAYKFLRYKQKSDAPALERLIVLGKKDAAIQQGLDRGLAVAGAVAWARDLVNEPAGAMTPTQLAEEARRAAEQGGLGIEVLDEVEIANQGLGGLLGVSLGSEQPPRLVKLTYDPGGKPRGTVALVGKGITFDAGGRLILADGLSLAAEEKPDAVIDLATLTGACMVALGIKVAGLMGNDDRWIDQVRSAADRAGESVWPLPLPQEYRKDLDSEI